MRPAVRLLDTAVERMSLSARGYDRVRKVARTIADLAHADDDRGRSPRRGVAIPDALAHSSRDCHSSSQASAFARSVKISSLSA